MNILAVEDNLQSGTSGLHSVLPRIEHTTRPRVVQTLDNAIHWINLYPVDSVISLRHVKHVLDNIFLKAFSLELPLARPV